MYGEGAGSRQSPEWVKPELDDADEADGVVFTCKTSLTVDPISMILPPSFNWVSLIATWSSFNIPGCGGEKVHLQFHTLIHSKSITRRIPTFEHELLHWNGNS